MRIKRLIRSLQGNMEALEGFSRICRVNCDGGTGSSADGGFGAHLHFSCQFYLSPRANGPAKNNDKVLLTFMKDSVLARLNLK